MLLPDPAQSIGRIVLVLGQPQLALLRNDVEDFALHVGKVRVASLFACFVDVELEEGSADEENMDVWVGVWTRIRCGRQWLCD